MKILVTGGAGFVGSYLVDALIERENEIVVFDNMSSGSHINKKAHIIKGNLLNRDDLEKIPTVDEVWHLAANPEVRIGDPGVHERQNFVASRNLIEWTKKKGIKKLYFTSTSTVYGEPNIIPTPEDYVPLEPISAYGASKLKAEKLIISSGLQYIIFRFANVVGSRSIHGVIYDFINKLRKNPEELEILGNGKQNKSYIYISDCIDAMLFCAKNVKTNEIFNIGTEDQIMVDEISKIVSNAMGLNPKFSYTGGKRGWKGDVPKMMLSIDKIKKLGWKPKYSSEESIRKTVEILV